MQIKSTLKQLIKNNPLYKDFIRPMRIKLKEKALAKLDDESYFIKRHKQIFGYTPDFKNPQTFNEKIIHRILFDRNPIYTALADKLKARIYIATTLQHFNPTHNTQDNTIYTTGGGGQPYSLNQNNIDLQNNPTLNTTTSIAPQTQNKENESINSTSICHTEPSGEVSKTLESKQDLNKDFSPFSKAQNDKILNSLLAKDSLLFQPIDTLTQELFNTNECQYLPKLYGIYKSVNEIDFSKLPQSFVLKTNHDCGGVVLVKDKVAFLKDSKSFNEAMTKLTTHLNTNFYTMYREWHYKDIEPRIFAEEMLGEQERGIEGQTLLPNIDTTAISINVLVYRFFTFGKTKYIQASDMDVYGTRYFYDANWNFQPFSYNNKILSDELPKPKILEESVMIANMLSYLFSFVRVDLYIMPQKVIVGELTFTPEGGTGRFTPQEWDKKLGDLWK
ncbi:ATP-grasp fold amidoligase family protein [Helicobacter cinaedi]|uniref:Putative glycosyltransferase n=1 Tax=Helicobacter cinaedi TaxID=213 RepID=A0A377JY99_9HELI|nr:ATP-grasp fold amidoligase family protein [Helicobacter cinaedi]STP13692.1 putative glycosyltransferase [Helicobacter cinaedi]